MRKLLRWANILMAILLITLNVLLIVFCQQTMEQLGGVWFRDDEAWVRMEQDQLRDRLNKEFPFVPPAEGEPLALDPGRIEAWLEVIAVTRNSYGQVERRLAERNRRVSAIDAPWLGLELGAVEALAETRRLREDLAAVRGDLLAALEKHRMSPDEYLAISAAATAQLAGGEAAREDVAQDPTAQVAAERARLDEAPQVVSVLVESFEDLTNALVYAHNELVSADP